MTRRLTIVIPTYDQSALLRECLGSLSEQTYSDFDVVVVDDASAEDIVAVGSEAMPSARVIRLETNEGFAVAANTGILAATSSEFVMLLNNDMTLEPECVARLMAVAEQGPAAMVAPLVLWKDDPDVVYSAGDRVLVGGRPESIGFREQRKTFRPDSAPFGVSAGAAIYRRSIFARIGILDQTFVAYFEDADLSFRARLAGFEAACVPDAIAYHVGSASQGGKTWWRSRQCYRNHALLVLKNMPFTLLLRLGVPILRERMHQSRMLLSSARAEFGLARALMEFAGAKLDIARHIPGILRARRASLAGRALSDQALRNLLSR